jgi:hypothetical protein
VQPDLDYEHEHDRKEKLELVIVDRVPFRAGRFSRLHILRSARPEQVLEAFDQGEHAATH